MVIFCGLGLPLAAVGQSVPGAFSRVEPGLDQAVAWKWEVKPSASPDWAQPPTPQVNVAEENPERAPGEDGQAYIVKKGDALVKIARRHKITVHQLKLANGLEKDLIVVGQELHIPTPEEIALMPAPTPTATSKRSSTQQREVTADFDPQVLLLQIYLDRMNFSPGPINGQTGLRFQKLMFAVAGAFEEAKDIEAFTAKAQSEVGELFTTYVLRPSDFRFIDKPRPQPSAKKSGGKPTAAERDEELYGQMTAARELLYRSPWEFVAERFHCEEDFLRKLNPGLKPWPEVGVAFRVPNTKPFEIEHALAPPLQPPPEESAAIKAVIADLSELEIYKDDHLIAVFPVSVARPGLRGRGEWKILDVVSLPMLETYREPRIAPKPVSLPGAPTPAPVRLLDAPEILAPGPRNPLGILWVNLAKANAAETVLPYGLHGTSSPERMRILEGIGGFRLTNWDIVRAVRLLPHGTPLRWRQSIAKPTAPVAPAAPAAPAAEPPTSVIPVETPE